MSTSFMYQGIVVTVDTVAEAAELLRSLATPDEGESEWIEWSGGECPVGPGVKVEVRFRKGSESNAPAVWNWGHEDHPYDIVAYRIVK